MAHRAGVKSGTPGQRPVTFLRSHRRGGYQPPAQYKPKMMNRVGRIPAAPRRNCRGGSQPPARYKPAITNQLGRIRTVSDVVPFNRTLLTRNKSGRLRASPTMGTNCMPFNQARGSVTLRAAGSRPYDGWAEICPPNYNFTISFIKPITESLVILSNSRGV